jgi:hypothetical protein
MSGFRIAHQAASPAATPKAKAAKNKGYLAFIHLLPCCVTGVRIVEAAHLSMAAPQFGHYGRGKSSKAADRWALPLSPEQHRRQHSVSEREYWSGVGINPHVLALTLWGLWSDMGEDAELFAAATINQHLAEVGRLPSRDLP